MVDTASPHGNEHPHQSGVEDLDTGRLGRVPLVSLSLASFIPAVGMALVPLLMFETAGTAAWPSALLGALAVIFVGLSVITFARRFVSTGSLYSYVAEVFGPWARYLTAAALFVGFVLQVGGIGGIVGIFTGSFLISRGFENALDFGPQSAIILGAIVIAAIVAIRGLDTSVRVAVGLAALSIPLVLIITIASAVHTGLDLSQQFDFDGISVSGILQGVAAGTTFLVGFESCTALAAETRDARRNIPLAVMSVPVVLGLLYLLCTILQVPGLIAASSDLEAGMSAPAALALNAGLGSAVATATDLVLAVACFAALIGFVNYGARFIMTLGIDNLLPERITSVNTKFRSPHVAIIVLSVLGFADIAAVMAVTGTVTEAYYAGAPLIVYAWVAPYILITVGAIILMLRAKTKHPLILVCSALGGITMAWVYLNGVINPPAPPSDAMSWVIVVVIALVLAVFVMSGRRRRPTTPPTPAPIRGEEEIAL
ncbi:APC family permease [Rhodococcus sp. WB9]|nr:APC family permease [Rhodococcus sp. WB9]